MTLLLIGLAFALLYVAGQKESSTKQKDNKSEEKDK